MIERKRTTEGANLIRRRRSIGVDDETEERKQRQRRQRDRLSSAPNNTFKSCVQFVAMSSLIPFLFFLRMSQQDEDSYLRRYSVSMPTSLPEPFDFLPDLLKTYAGELRQSTAELDHEWLESDIAELHHCHSIFTTSNTNPMDWTEFTTWAGPWVNKTMRQLQVQRPSKGMMSEEDEDIAQQEIILELLEIYGTQYGYCKFHRYRPTFVHGGENVFADTATLPRPPQHARLAFVVTVRRHDLAHIKRLVQAIHMPHHYIVLHLDMQADDKLQSDLLEMAQEYENVVVVRFGTMHTGMDGMTNVHLKLMRWLTIDLNLKYDLHINLDGASYPLLSAEDMAQRLYASTQSVWLGTLTEQGNLVRESQRTQLINKQLVTTNIPETATLGAIFPEPNLPDFLLFDDDEDAILNYKTSSGSYAVFSQSIVRQLLSSSKAMQIFGLSKYGSGSLDNYNWMAALQVLDQQQGVGSQIPSIQQEAKTHTAMFQLFGGGGIDVHCEDFVQDDKDSEQSAILTMDASHCYRIEHPQVVKAVHNESYAVPDFDWTIPRDRLFVHGGPELVKFLQHAREVGFLFARQFDSNSPQSMALLKEIERGWTAR